MQTYFATVYETFRVTRRIEADNEVDAMEQAVEGRGFIISQTFEGRDPGDVNEG